MGRRRTSHKESIEPEHASSAGEEDNQGDFSKVPEEGQRQRKKYKQNWRLNMLSVPKVLTSKYVEPPYKLSTGVQGDALKAEITERTEQLALSGMRYLKVNKALYTPTRGPEYGKLMDNYIERAWNSSYNYYRKSLYDLKQKKHQKINRRWSSQGPERKGKKGKGKDKPGSKIGKKGSKISEKSKETIMKELEQWCTERSQPKAITKPPPIDRGPIADLEAMKSRQDEMALPKRVYKSPSTDSNFKDPTKVSPAALTYEPSERIGVLARPLAHRLLSLKAEEIMPGAVKPSALTYQISDRVKILATPKPTTTARESDLNEDAFTISPAAMKYVASPRILEMAKPKEYAF